MRNLIIVAACLLTAACMSDRPGGSQSPSNPASSTAAGGFGAQTNTGTQGQAQTPQTTSAGPATQNWYFASQVSSAVQEALLKLAAEAKWTAEQTIAGLKATNGAPDNVTITNHDNTITSGSPEATGASGGTGGGGTTGNVTKP